MMQKEECEISRRLQVRCKKCGAWAELREEEMTEYMRAGCPNGCNAGFTEPKDMTPESLKCKCGKVFRSTKWLKKHRDVHAY